jgi:hypothetical protein
MAIDELSAVDDAGDINLANALDLSESEEEEEMENIIVDFSQDREEREVNDFARYILTFLTCGAGSRLATRASVLFPVPRTLPYFRLRTTGAFR